MMLYLKKEIEIEKILKNIYNGHIEEQILSIGKINTYFLISIIPNLLKLMNRLKIKRKFQKT